MPDEVRDMRGGFAWVAFALIDRHGRALGAQGLAVYLVLARHAGFESQQCFVAHKRIADLTGLGRTTIIASLHRLRDLGLIAIEERQDERGQHSNRYTLLPLPRSPDGRGGTPDEGGGAGGERPPSATRTHGTTIPPTKGPNERGVRPYSPEYYARLIRRQTAGEDGDPASE